MDRGALGGRPARPGRCIVALVWALVLAGCQAAPAPPSPHGVRAPRPASLHVLMINGGGTPPQNYRSHLLHVEQLVDLVRQAGVPSDHVSVLSADGPDPTLDLAVREVQANDDFWLLQGTTLEAALRPPTSFANSSLPGVALLAATRFGVEAWFARARTRLHRGDTLFVYVTDHGSKNDADTRDNRITLWGGDTLSVSELRGLIATLPGGVRVVTLMSQCFSGSFANLVATPESGELPSGRVCGFFSSTADRPAYGCYPENRGRDNVGHSFHFLRALAATPDLPRAHAETLVTDATPDVPITSSDIYLDGLVGKAADAAGQGRPAFIDVLLAEAWHDKAAWEPEIRLLDRIGHAFGLFSPRSLAELEEQAKRLPEASETLKTYASAWKAALGDLTQANLDRFLVAQPTWASRVALPGLQGLQPAAVHELTTGLLGGLVPFTRRAPARAARLHLLRKKGETAAAATYRMEVRLGVVLRMRAILISIAGRQYLRTRATAAERDAYQALRDCEAFQLHDAPLRVPASAAEAASEPFPPYEADLRLAQHVLPAWMGIRFKAPSAKELASHGLHDGTAAVVTVYPDSPAAAAGFEAGDLVVGPAGSPFTEPNQIRAWTMLSRVGERAPLDVVRGGQHLRLTLVPKPFPLKWPELPGPPRAGTAAPPLALSAYRGTLPRGLADGRKHLLFFWATWCLPCKAALPEVLAFEQTSGAQVIAITDEQPEQLDAFFQHFPTAFPATVAVDEYRRAFLAYGVSGTPTFVLVDGAGAVQSYATGYTPERGLALEGWSRPATSPPSPE